MPEDLTPFPRPASGRQVVAWPATPRRDRMLFAGWCAALFAAGAALTLALVHRAVSSPAHDLPGRYLVAWASTAAGALVLLAVLGGLLVFERRTPVSVAMLRSLLGGPMVAAGYLVGLTGQMDPGSVLCSAPANGSCDTAWGLGAFVVALGASVVIGVLFTVAFSLKRVSSRT